MLKNYPEIFEKLWKTHALKLVKTGKMRFFTNLVCKAYIIALLKISSEKKVRLKRKSKRSTCLINNLNQKIFFLLN